MSILIDEEPRPRGTPDTTYASLEWPISRSVKCANVSPPSEQPFLTILEARRSHRVMAHAPLGELVNAVAFCTRPRAKMYGEPFQRSRRPSPSAGALHPVDILLVHDATQVSRYVPLSHRLQTLHVSAPEHLEAFGDDCRRMLPDAPGTAIVLVGDISSVEATYDRPESLLWRDGGALMQTLFLVMTAYQLAFCPLGILGTRVVHAIGLSEHATAIGVALAGRHEKHGDSHLLG